MRRATAPLLALVIASCAAQGHPAEGWKTLGQLSAPRAYPSVVALPTGELMVFGGIDMDDPSVVKPTTELVDPASGKVAVLPQRLPGRINHTATLTTDGLVIVAGGTEFDKTEWLPMDRVDVYVPTERRWRSASPLQTGRSDHGAAALKDGRVLVTGGNRGIVLLRSSEIYDPKTDTWKPAAPMPTTRARSTMVTLSDGRVLVAGGLEVNGSPSRTSLLYDPSADKWRSGPLLSVERVLHSTVQLPSGDVMFIGGQHGASGSAERFVASTGAFVHAGALVQPRMGAQAAALADGGVLIAGGLIVDAYKTTFDATSRAEQWDPTTNTWHEVAAAPTARALGRLVPTKAGLIQIGGAQGDRALASIEIFGPQ